MSEIEDIAQGMSRAIATARAAFHEAMIGYNERVAVDNEVYHECGGTTEGSTEAIVQALLDAGWSPPRC